MKKIIIKTALIAGCVTVLLGIFSFVNQNIKKGSIIIRSQQITGGKWKVASFIKIYKTDGSFEKIPLDQKEYIWLDNEENFDKIIATVRKYEQIGYETTSHIETITEGSYSFCAHTFILTEK